MNKPVLGSSARFAGLVVISGSLLVSTASAQIGSAREHYLEFFADTSVSNAFGALFVNSNNDVMLLNQRFGGAGTTVVINQNVVFSAGDDPDVSNGTIPDYAGISNAGGWAYQSFFGLTTNQTIVTDAGIVLTEGDEFLPDLFAADTVFATRMADDGTIFAVVDLGDAVGNDTDRGLVRITDYDSAPTYEVVLQGGTTVTGTDVGSGLRIGSNSSNANLQAQGGINDDYNISQNGRYVISAVDVVGDGIGTTNDKSVVLTDLMTGTSTVVLREGTPTGDGDNFDNVAFAEPQVHVNNAGNTVVMGDTDGDTSQDGYLAYNGEIIAREGQSFDGFTLGNTRIAAFNNLDQHISVWDTDQGESLFFGEGDGPLTQIISVGDTFTYFDDVEGAFLEATIDDILSAPIALTTDGRAYIQVEFTDGVGFSEFFGVIEVTVVPAPSTGVLALVTVTGLAKRRRRSA